MMKESIKQTMCATCFIKTNIYILFNATKSDTKLLSFEVYAKFTFP